MVAGVVVAVHIWFWWSWRWWDEEGRRRLHGEGGGVSPDAMEIMVRPSGWRLAG
ncbi:hypothetical protein HAX54_033026, partial [Datura stramonium]|nr:hypothetical protein [Datura stramonium]